MGRSLLSSRRDFLKVAAAGTLAAPLVVPASALADEEGGSIAWDVETDVVVCGGGGSGFAAAIEAAEAGCSVVVLEKGSVFGGSTMMCGQAIMGIGTSVQKAMGIEDSVDKALGYFSAIGDAREDLMRLILERSGETVDWLIDLGMQVPAEAGRPGLTCGGQELTRPDLGEPTMRTHWSVAPEPGLWPVLEAAGLANPLIDAHVDCGAASLVQESAGGAILGVIDDNGVTYRARKGVVLATGSFARNPELIDALVTRHELQTTANLQDMGDGLKMGMAAGAGVGYFGILSVIDYAKPLMSCVFVVLGPDTMEGKPPFIMINKEGKRWSNERKFYSYICEDLLGEPDAVAWILTCGEAGLKGLSRAGEEAFAADTLEDLADQMGIPAEDLIGSVTEWNDCCAAGVDTQFGRTTELYPIPLDSGPYYAAEVRPSCACTFGGVNVDTDMHVLSALTDGPIPHLYGAGMNTMASGRFYPTCGYAVATAIVTGRVAGVAVANEEPLF